MSTSNTTTNATNSNNNNATSTTTSSSSPSTKKGKPRVMLQSMVNASTIERATPEADANILSRLTLLWITSLVWKGWRQPLRDEDLWELLKEEQSHYTVGRFQRAWRYCKDIKSYKRLVRALWNIHWLFILSTAFLRVVDVVLGQIQPIFLSELLKFLGDKSIEGNGQGFLWAFMLFLVPFLKTIVENHYFLKAMRLGIRVQSALQGALYGKSLRMSPSARNASTVGEIVNLMQIDSQKIGDFTRFMHVLWAAPLQLTISVVLLYVYIGPSAFIGLLITLLTIPLHSKLVRKQANLRKKTVIISDKRVKMMNEILQGIKAVKFYAWEKPFAEEVGKTRAEELKTLHATIWVRSGFMALMMSIPTVMAIITFSLYAGVFKETLDAAKVFTGIALLNQLRQPVIVLPFVFSSLIDAKLGVKRLHRFLTLDNTSDYARSRSSGSQTSTDRSTAKTRDDSISNTDGEDKSASSSTDPEIVSDVDAKKGKVEHQRTHDEAFVSITDGSFSWGSAESANIRDIKMSEHRGLFRSCIPKRFRIRGNDEQDAQEASKDPEGMSERDESGGAILHDISFSVKAGQLTAIIGRVGSGKSSLVHAILGEMEKLKGSVVLQGTVAFVAQNAWIFNDTLQNNILFGRKLDQRLYQRAIKVSALEADIAQFSAGDQTMIGEKGINLSGGQKQRVSIARAIYSDADIYIFDDPLSALDVHVAQTVFERCISKTGILRNRLRLIVTNQLQFLPECDDVLLLHDGRIRKQGSYNTLMSSDPEFKVLMEESMGDKEREEEKGNEETQQLYMSTTSRKETSEYQDTGRSSFKAEDSMDSEKDLRGEEVGKNLMTDEEREVGNMTVRAYYRYAVACGGIIVFTLIVLFYSLSTATQILSTWWLSYWTEQEQNNTTRPLSFFLGIYFALGFGFAIMSFLRSAWYLSAALVAARNVHAEMFDSVMRAPMVFFDTTPIGRIISRFSRDVFGMDQLLPQAYSQFFSTVINLIGSYVSIVAVTPLFAAVAIPIALFYYFFQRFYNRTSLELKRLDAVSKSPIYANFSETLGGLSTIRAYGKEQEFKEENLKKIDTNLRAYYSFIASNRWFSLYLEIAGSILIFAAASFSVLRKGEIFEGNAGLALTYGLSVTSILGMTVRSITEVEAQMNAVERMQYYARELPQEAPAILDELPKNDNGQTVDPTIWPRAGRVEIRNLEMRYREHLELVLKGLTVTFEAGEKIGIVGRTGAGKSSLMIVLLRLVEPCGGSILIDGVDISTIGLDLLRKKITIIPQEPVLFSGTIRFNLDPFEEYSDAEVWNALGKSQLKEFVSNFDGQLDGKVSEYGQNLSVGQRQMICLTRALLRKPKVLIMDEATSSVDFETDQTIQDTIRREFVGCTVLTIAHRLWTIADYDKVLAMDNGVVGEYGTPTELLEKENGHLTFLVNSMGESGAEKFKEMVRGKTVSMQ